MHYDSMCTTLYLFVGFNASRLSELQATSEASAWSDLIAGPLFFNLKHAHRFKVEITWKSWPVLYWYTFLHGFFNFWKVWLWKMCWILDITPKLFLAITFAHSIIGDKLFLTTCLGWRWRAINRAQQTRASRFSVLPWAKRKTHTLPIARLLRKIFHPRYKANKYYCASLFQGRLQIGIAESPDLS